MKAFLLVAGRGARLKPITDLIPKCLLPVHGLPLLQIWLEHLESSGVEEVLINTHWLHEKVQQFVASWTAVHSRMNIRLFHEPVLLGSAGTILANRQWAGPGPFFIIYGDNLTRFDLREMMVFHRNQQQPITIRTYRGADPTRVAIVCLDEEGIVTDFEEKPAKPRSDLGAGGIYIADRRIFEYYPQETDGRRTGPLDLSYHVLPRMTGRMKAYLSNEISLDIGTPASYAEAERVWREM
jgi:mannose-1-phosphate guanylyltransferase